jgi:hypothetical protein
MKQKLVSIIYQSKALVDALSAEEQALMDYVLVENRKLNVTGFLMRTNTHYYQYLEGKEQTINELLKRIGENPLHTDFRILCQNDEKRRKFPRWYMEYYFLTDLKAQKRLGDCFSDHDLADAVCDLMVEKAKKRSYLQF